MLWAKPAGALQDDVRRFAEHLSAWLLALEALLGGRHAPGLMGDTAQREARLLDRAPLKLEAGGDGNQSEGIGQAVPDLQIAVVAREPLGRQLDRGDDLVGGKVGVDRSGVSPGSR